MARSAVSSMRMILCGDENKLRSAGLQKHGTVAAKFSLSKVEKWWTGSANKSDDF